MAINLWEKGGQPTAYNPLPLNYVNNAPVELKSYSISFKAKSNSGSTLRVWTTQSALGLNAFPSLTAEFKTFEYDFVNKISQQVFFRDEKSIGDIIIEDIKLVEKPVSPVKIPEKNLFTPFTSADWLHYVGARIVSEYKLEITRTGAGQVSYSPFYQVMKNQTYTINCEHNGKIFLVQHGINGEIVENTVTITSKSHTFTTRSDCHAIRVGFGESVNGIYTFEKPMIALGNIAQPFEPYKEVNLRAVNKVPKKNLFNREKSIEKQFVNSGTGVLYSSTQRNSVSELIEINPNTDYFPTNISCNGNGTLGLAFYNGGKSFVGGIHYPGSSLQKFTTPSSARYVQFTFDTDIQNIQFEEGTVATPYEPYKEVNRGAVGLIPMKNMISKIINSSFPSSVNGVITDSFVKAWRTDFIPIDFEKSYFLSGLDEDISSFVSFYDTQKNYITRTPGYTRSDMLISKDIGTVSALSIASYIIITQYTYDNEEEQIRRGKLIRNKLQLEEGTTPTPYEPYALVNPPARTGLVMNGTTDYLQLPSVTMDSVEIDCLIDSIQIVNPILFDARNAIVSGLIYANGGNSSGYKVKVDNADYTGAFPMNKRVLIQLNSPSGIFTESASVFASNLTKEYKLKGIVYNVKCYLNNQVVAEYNFETENEKAYSVIRGNPVFQRKLARR